MAASERPIHITGWRIHVLQLPLRGTFHWAAHSEDRIDVILLEVDGSNGSRGVAEMAVREKWHGETVASVVSILNENVLPAAARADLHDEGAYAIAISATPPSAVARALVDMAREDILAQDSGEPLWRRMARAMGQGLQGLQELQGSGEPQDLQDSKVAAEGRADFSCTITRAEPAKMAAEAVYLAETVGARAFKIKTGQGYDIDTAAFAAIRSAVGEQVFLSADSNSAGPPEQVARMADMLASHDVRWFEDPCRLQSDTNFQTVQEASCVPVLVDNACRSLPSAEAFLRLGAQGLSVKLMKTGLVESRAVARAVAAVGARMTVGLCASTSLSALYSLSFYSSLPSRSRAMPCEETFFLNLPQDLLHQQPHFNNGAVVLPPAAPMASLIDWAVVHRFAVARPLEGLP